MENKRMRGTDMFFYILACIVFLFFLIWLSKKIDKQIIKFLVFSFLIISSSAYTCVCFARKKLRQLPSLFRLMWDADELSKLNL